MHLNVNEDGTVQAWGVAVKGNVNIEDSLLPGDFYDNAFWKYSWNGEGFDSLKAVINEDGTVGRIGFNIEGGVDVPLDDIKANPTLYTYVNGEFVHVE